MPLVGGEHFAEVSQRPLPLLALSAGSDRRPVHHDAGLHSARVEVVKCPLPLAPPRARIHHRGESDGVRILLHGRHGLEESQRRFPLAGVGTGRYGSVDADEVRAHSPPLLHDGEEIQGARPVPAFAVGAHSRPVHDYVRLHPLVSRLIQELHDPAPCLGFHTRFHGSPVTHHVSLQTGGGHEVEEAHCAWGVTVDSASANGEVEGAHPRMVPLAPHELNGLRCPH
mmetsp:Transcript_24312/g.33304  ORF Transcript_24312/g.33304 Transcript_24312/m.33304 type:complete len:226 (-) Transcript_24312:283-960(-)